MGKESGDFALVTRLQKSETPFLNEFLAYYTNLGIHHFYLVNTEPQNGIFIKNSVAQEYSEKITFIDKQPEDTMRECQNRALPYIKETYLIHLDMDEFMYLNGMTLNEFIESEGLDRNNMESVECFFYWVMSPLCSELFAPSIGAILSKRYFFPSGAGKSLSRTQDIVKINNHNFELKGSKTIKEYDSRKKNCFVFHVSARGIYDIINKVQFWQFEDLKKASEPAKELSDLFFKKSSNFLPNRFILLSFQSKFEPHLIDVDFKFPLLDYKTDTNLLKKITFDGLKDQLDIEASPEDIEKTVVEKINRFQVPKHLVDLYAAGEINLLRVLKHFDEIKKKKPRGLFSRIFR